MICIYCETDEFIPIYHHEDKHGHTISIACEYCGMHYPIATHKEKAEAESLAHINAESLIAKQQNRVNKMREKAKFEREKFLTTLEDLQNADAKAERLIELITHIIKKIYIEKNTADITKNINDVFEKQDNLFFGILISRVHRDDRIKIFRELGITQ